MYLFWTTCDTSALCFKARVDPSRVWFVACMQFIPQIHLWCDTCWPSTQKSLFDPRTCTHIVFWSTPLKCSTESPVLEFCWCLSWVSQPLFCMLRHLYTLDFWDQLLNATPADLVAASSHDFIRRTTILFLLCFCSKGCCTWGCSCQ